MKANPVKFLEEFLANSNGTQYVIPVYQRNYAWDKNDQVNRLYEDITNLLENKNKTHFLGTIVYCHKVVLNNTERSVIDGQQRLVTLFLSLYALAKISENANPTFSQMIKSKYLENSYGEEKYKLRLKPMVSDDQVFEYIALGKWDDFKEFSGKSSVKENYNYIVGKLQNYIDNGYTYDEIRDAIDRFYIVYIQLDEPDNAQEIFESLNSTGMKLRASDLIRNYILMNKDNDTQENIYKDYWKKYEAKVVESKNLETFFRNYLASKQFNLCNINKIYDEFKKYWSSEATDFEHEKLILKNILNSVEVYNSLYLSNDSVSELEPEISVFRRIRYETPAPFMLGIFELYRDGKISSTQLKNTIGIVNSYFIRRFLAGKEANDISRFFPMLLKYVLDSCEKRGYDKFEDIVKTELIFKNMSNNAALPTDVEIQENLKSANFYIMKYKTYIISQLEAAESRVALDLDKLTVEHIMPQKRKDEWVDITSDLSDEEYANYVNRLGNLTLAAKGDNSQMGNENFSDKKKILQKSSHIKMNEEILSKNKWTIDDIKKRTTSLTNRLLSLYPYIKSSPYDEEDKDKIYIFDENQNIIATGYKCEDNKVIVYAGSLIKYDIESNPSINSLRDDYIIDETITREEDGTYVLNKDTILNSPTAAANFVLGGDRHPNVWKKRI